LSISRILRARPRYPYINNNNKDFDDVESSDSMIIL